MVLEKPRRSTYISIFIQFICLNKWWDKKIILIISNRKCSQARTQCCSGVEPHMQVKNKGLITCLCLLVISFYCLPCTPLYFEKRSLSFFRSVSGEPIAAPHRAWTRPCWRGSMASWKENPYPIPSSSACKRATRPPPVQASSRWGYTLPRDWART